MKVRRNFILGELLDEFLTQTNKKLRAKKRKPKIYHPKVAERPSNRKLFKERYGFSKTMKNNMVKAEVFDQHNTKSSLAEYRKLQRERRKAEARIKKDKHNKAVAGRKIKQSKTTIKKAA